MMKKTIFAAALALITCTGTALADGKSSALKIVRDTTVMPPDTYDGQWWTHPKGCEYSRAGRPGEIVWYLIINTVQPGCPNYIVQRGFNDAY
ncbi:hypothetical protein [uncultured Roseovarius sp.]|uniref:hypothetical protein n=1 Tax=uncultured Roseovarius sp. TaxID=293344 RepID=UPI00260F6DD9|nr:hypothetical protein [uncultured Roseovarius sp.]